jgi:hypothetical protein
LPGKAGQRPQVVEGGFPHSEILGSKLVRSSPRLIAAYHVLHRLSAPRHPPNALKTLDRSHDPCAPRSGSHHLNDAHRKAVHTINHMRPLGSDAHDQNYKDHSLEPSGRPDPRAASVQTIRSFMLQRARSIMQAFTHTTLAGLITRPSRYASSSSSQCQTFPRPGREGKPVLERSTHTGSVRSLTDTKPVQPSKANQRSAIGGARRDRTDDLLNANQALSQLSYGPIFAQRRWFGTRRPQDIRTTNA